MSKRIKTTKNLLLGIGIFILVLLLILFLLIANRGKNLPQEPLTPTLTVKTLPKISLSQTEEFTVDVTITSFGKATYPAASMSISFDSSRLEFLGVKEGNVFIKNEESNPSQKLPVWSCNTEQCNKSGKINIMYLDTTGGRNAFTQHLLASDDNVVLRLNFRLRGSARVGDVYDLILDDAVFAASDETESLAMTTNTLSVRNGKIIIGE